MEIIYRPPDENGQWMELGPYKLRALIDRQQEGALTCYLVRLAPHSRTRTSYHGKAEEIYYVLSGRGTAILNGEAYPLTPGTFLRLPPRTLHAFCTGEEPLELLDIHSPGSWPDRDLFFVDEENTSDKST
ncbi:MAG: cupin domain-containing protein [Thermoguttaceae bacterium]|nr:cupin domain-containing protein [Thermoguttaceae bacterium]MDW8079830.1 cupin domain-containing protein [Thermoguttaceae bacterium]